ncbi:Crp/Fnr family transcriptional regulator (plasmid) [Sphingobium sp. SJ10-10]|uniref:Crp/Fnr family transcriptional regulator n=1 Tax=unclassified Sphingobium TaxID=2611147 RepID=UPI000770319C|nr:MULTISPECIES: Crp/Fnr family transcriptional regulator [unclassified Sphingobium]AMK25474.1 Crp/Fnr-family transcriptional regulator [Sphingobium sp. TKS]MEC6702111.1 Crp/Fnr family transcriptional regulator [Sphingobium sp. SJ10-10]NML90608.1 Crp/Fnr family transcriptional regulator [Sphingobium sp. TB-6]
MIFADFLRNRRRDQLSDEDLAALEASIGHVRKAQARQIIARAGEPIRLSTYLMEGFICRYMDDRNGLRQLVAVHVPGDFVDLHGYPLGRLDHDVATLGVCKIALIPHEALDGLLVERPNLTKLLWFSTLLDAAMHREWIFRLGRLDAIARIAHFFCEIEAKLRAVGLSDGREFTFPLTQADLGEACGMTPVHINRMLRELRERKLLQMRRSRITIFDLAALRQLSDYDPSYLFIEG